MLIRNLLLVSILLTIPITAQLSTLDDAFQINMSGIVSQRMKMTLTAENIANLMTLKDEETGLPYQKKYVVLESSDLG
ncbi:hypothetical protein CL657_04610, partial [bacterium]|nr:hypothetical protein [bacterium]